MVFSIVGAIVLHRFPTSRGPWWAYAVFGYAFLVAPFPWLLGMIDGDEVSLPMTIMLAIVVATPFAIIGYTLGPTTHNIIRALCWVMVGLWGVHLAATLVVLAKGRAGTDAKA